MAVGENYQPYFEGNRLVFPTEQEAEYPQGLCEAYSEGAAVDLGLDHHVQAAHLEARGDAIHKELAAYHRCGDPELRDKMANQILAIENMMTPGQEAKHLAWLLAQGHYRGSDVRLSLEHCGAKHLVPYPAMRWLWRETLSFKWKAEAHINVLEAQALLSHVRRMLREGTFRSCRVLIVIDSQVLYFALGKGRSPSTQLNRVLRRLMAMELAADVALFPVWTISPWNWADKPSRRR